MKGGTLGLALALGFALSKSAHAQPARSLERDPRFGSECWEGAPRTADNEDCPLPLRTGGHDDRWDDLFPWAITARVAYMPPALGGWGFALTHFPARAVGFRLGLDVFGGVDSDGNRHSELPITLDAWLFYARGPTLQGYLLGGVMFSHVRTQDDSGAVEHRNYFAPLIGTGLQIKGARDIGWSFDAIGIARGSQSADSNFLGIGALLRASVNFYPR